MYLSHVSVIYSIYLILQNYFINRTKRNAIQKRTWSIYGSFNLHLLAQIRNMVFWSGEHHAICQMNRMHFSTLIDIYTKILSLLVSLIRRIPVSHPIPILCIPKHKQMKYKETIKSTNLCLSGRGCQAITDSHLILQPLKVTPQTTSPLWSHGVLVKDGKSMELQIMLFIVYSNSHCLISNYGYL